MFTWVLNTPLLFEKTLQTFYFLKVFYIIWYFTSFYSFKHAIKHLIIKPLDLLNTIPLTRIKTLVTNLLTSETVT